MIRLFMLRILIVVLISYILYVLYKYFSSKSKRGQGKTKTMRDLESADYDKDEWEKIKEELKKK